MVSMIKVVSQKVSIQEIIWVLCAMVVPLTIWFVAISYKIDNANAKILVIQESEKENRQDFKDLDNKVSGKLDRIIKELGIVKGQLKRISR